MEQVSSSALSAEVERQFDAFAAQMEQNTHKTSEGEVQTKQTPNEGLPAEG